RTSGEYFADVFIAPSSQELEPPGKSGRFSIELDWSDGSIEQVEKIAAALHEDYVRTRPTPEQVAPFYKAIGSYIGEVYRKNHGAEWGWVTLNGQRFPGMWRDKVGVFWPWGKAQNRIINGSED